MDSFILSDLDVQAIQLWLSKMNDYKDESYEQRINYIKSNLRLNYKFIGAGWNRIVYDLQNGYVLKVAIRDCGFLSNEREYHLYTHGPPRLRKHLCPVKKYGHGWIIMEKVDLKPPINQSFNKKLIKTFLRAGIEPHDLKVANLGLSKKGKIIVIDYGNFKYQNFSKKEKM